MKCYNPDCHKRTKNKSGYCSKKCISNFPPVFVKICDSKGVSPSISNLRKIIYSKYLSLGSWNSVSKDLNINIFSLNRLKSKLNIATDSILNECKNLIKIGI